MSIPYHTIRTTTERPVTVEIGTNILVGDNFNLAKIEVIKILNGKRKQGKIPDKWDGKLAKRICDIIADKLL